VIIITTVKKFTVGSFVDIVKENPYVVGVTTELVKYFIVQICIGACLKLH